MGRIRRKRRKRAYVSAPELDMVSEIKKRWPTATTQVHLFKQLLDAYVPELDAYVQLDGVYWHGLDPSLEKSSIIRRKMRKDAKLNSMFEARSVRGPKLFRISDKQWLHARESGTVDAVMESLRSAPPGVLTVYDGPPGYRPRD